MSSTSATNSTTNFNYMASLLNEIKKFYQNTHQLNILLRETNNACKELKILQKSSITGIFDSIFFTTTYIKRFFNLFVNYR